MRSGKKAQSMFQVDVPLKGNWCPFAVGYGMTTTVSHCLYIVCLLSILLRGSWSYDSIIKLFGKILTWSTGIVFDLLRFHILYGMSNICRLIIFPILFAQKECFRMTKYVMVNLICHLCRGKGRLDTKQALFLGVSLKLLL